MKKILALVLAAVMLLTVAPVFAETTEPAPEKSGSGLADILGDLLGASSDGEGDSKLSDKLGGLLGGLLDGSDDGAGSKLGSLLSGLKDKAKDKLSKLSAKMTLLKDILKRKIDKAKNAAKLLKTLAEMAVKSSAKESGEEKKSSGIISLFGALLGGSDGKTGAGAGSSEGSDSSVLSALFGGLLSDSPEEMTEEETAKWLEEYHKSPEYLDEQAREAAIEAHVLDEYKDSLEAGDVQFVCIGSGIDDIQEDGSFKYLRNLSLTNFTLDGKNLKMKNYANAPELVYLAKNEAGVWTVTEATQAADGMTYADSIAAMSEKYGAEIDTVKLNLGEKDWAEAFNLAFFLREHDEYEKAEYQGELRTAEELDAIADEALDAALAGVDFSF